MLKRVIKVIAAILIFVVLFDTVQGVLTGAKDTRDAKRMRGFYDRKENELDVVCIGSSGMYAFWCAPYAWHEFGISVYPMATSGQYVSAAKYLIDEAKKTQPDAEIVINISSMQLDADLGRLHDITDNMPFSINKLKLIQGVSESVGFTEEEQKEFYFPILRYHDRWTQLTAYDFKKEADEYLSGNTYPVHLKKKTNVTPEKPYTEFYEELPDNTRNDLNDLMDYCEEKEYSVLFILVPQGKIGTRQAGLQNAAADLIAERGFEMYDMRAYADEIGMDYKKDYYNAQHANIYGALKVTKHFSEYLIEKYDLQDKRGQKEYAEWDEKSENYYNDIIVPRKADEGL